jgi:microcystin-dependent protein
MYGGEVNSTTVAELAAEGWLLCRGQVLPRQRFDKLWDRVGTTYNVGGEPPLTFRIPGFQGRAPIGEGAGYALNTRVLGEHKGEENHVLSGEELPPHSHEQSVRRTGANRLYAPVSGDGSNENHFGWSGPTGVTGSGAAHNNMQPYLVVHFLIAYGGPFQLSADEAALTAVEQST